MPSIPVWKMRGVLCMDRVTDSGEHNSLPECSAKHSPCHGNRSTFCLKLRSNDYFHGNIMKSCMATIIIVPAISQQQCFFYPFIYFILCRENDNAWGLTSHVPRLFLRLRLYCYGKSLFNCRLL